MKISSKGRYALRLMIDLAQHNTGENIALKDISKRQQISIKYLEQIVSQLSKSGLVVSVRGPLGGYRLAKSPNEYNAGDILRVTEGSLSPIGCIEGDKNPCDRAQECPTVDFWIGLDKVIKDYVDGITLEDLVNRYMEKNGNNYII